MRKILLLICVLVIRLSWATASNDQVLQLNVNLKQAGGTVLWMIVRDENTGAQTPYMFHLSSQRLYQAFKIEGGDYRFVLFNLQRNGQTFTPCDFGPDIIHNTSTKIVLSGSMAGSRPQISCDISHIKGLQLVDVRGQASDDDNSPSASSAPAQTTKAAATSTSSSNQYQGIINYLHALKTCSKGGYEDTINKQQVTYAIMGKENDACSVQISIKGQDKPISCRFTDADVKTLASDDQIKMYQSGVIDTTSKSQVTQVMNQACKS